MNPQEENKNSQEQKTQNPQQGIKGSDFYIRPLRTYEDDVKNAVQKDNISTAKILMAEQQRRQVEQTQIEESSPTSKTNIPKIILTFVFIILGIAAAGGGYYYYTLNQIKIPEQITVLTSNNFIDVDHIQSINKTGKTNREVVGEIRNIITSSGSEIKEDSIKQIKIVKTVTTIDNGRELSSEVEISTEEFLNILEAREPDALTRSLDKKFLLGVHKNKEGIEPFIIFKTNDYEISYAKMLEWEYILISDIKDIFFKNLGSSQAFLKYEEDLENSTTTTNEVVIPKYDDRNFKDLILANKDTRAISSEDGELLFFYSFINKDHLILTTNSDTLTILINRLNTAKLIR